MKIITLLLLVFVFTGLQAQEANKWKGKFEQLDYLLPTPNDVRSGSGAPGAKYWQQRADYVIDAEIDEPTNTLRGKETITYYNNSPDGLKFLWLQLDQNVNKKGNEDFSYINGKLGDSISSYKMQQLARPIKFEAGYTIKSVTDKLGKTLTTAVNNTMMRVDLPVIIKTGESYTLQVEWSYPITDRSLFLLSREGYEHFPADNNNIYLIAHWFPRMCVYDDIEGWQNKQFQRLGEFALEFGNYKVNITIPSDHVVASTGTLQNTKELLSGKSWIALKKQNHRLINLFL